MKKSKSGNTTFWAKVLVNSPSLIGFVTAIILVFQIHEMQVENRLDQRAWVMPIQINTSAETFDKRFRITFQNTGKTPALEVSGWTIADNSLSWDEGSKKPFPLKCLIPPNGTITNDPFANSIVCPIGSASKVSANATPIFFFGKVWYKDIFGGSHWIEFSYRITKIGGETGFIIQPWGDHNKTDDKQIQE